MVEYKHLCLCALGMVNTRECSPFNALTLALTLHFLAADRASYYSYYTPTHAGSRQQAAIVHITGSSRQAGSLHT